MVTSGLPFKPQLGNVRQESYRAIEKIQHYIPYTCLSVTIAYKTGYIK